MFLYTCKFMSAQPPRTSQYKGKRPRKPSDPRYSPKGRRTDRRQRRRRPRRNYGQRFRSSGMWVLAKGASSMTGEVMKFIFLPVILPLRAFSKWRKKGKK